jgi:hypothetical protein
MTLSARTADASGCAVLSQPGQQHSCAFSLMYAGHTRNGFTPASRRTVFLEFEGLLISKCPFGDLPESGKSRWGEDALASAVLSIVRDFPQVLIREPR